MSPIGTVEKPATKKAVKKAPGTKKAKSAAAHPPYFQMIKEALLALGEKGGSSPHAIAKYMEEKHKSVLPDNFRKMLALQLKNSASKGKLTKVKASYKLSDAAKKDKPAVKKAKKPAARASADVATVKKGVVKKPVVKKSAAKKVKKTPVKAKKAKKTPVKAKAKQPKSIKSPAAKKARKAAA
ncbi:Histone H1/H5 [Artemisia annua]|uniref:Histone H1/H5 n=1 Tax=Artemisia annua TaxID=35608 RepID=A0A2U1KI75_ARTAN|nr:Histone H1/H5 [Artemisia annua]